MGLGDLPGGSFASRAHAVSGDGSVVVGEGLVSSGPEAFRWTAEGGMEGLGDLEGGIFHSTAAAVSADGSVVAGWSVSGEGREAFRWSETEGLQGLADLPGGPFESVASDVSADGSVIVGTSDSCFCARLSSRDEAFRWSSADGMVGLGDAVPQMKVGSGASAISGDGSRVAGFSFNFGSGSKHVVLWSEGTDVRVLGDLPGGRPEGAASAISSDGSTVVGLGYSDSGFEAFRWTQEDGIVGLGDLQGGGFSSKALGVSADGTTVAGSGHTDSGFRAFIWDEAHGMRDLQDVLEGELGLDLMGWTLSQATGVSDDGRTIVGSGTNAAGDGEAWIAVVPEPASDVLGGCAIATLLLLRPHRAQTSELRPARGRSIEGRSKTWFDA